MLLADCGEPRVEHTRNFSPVGRAFRGARSHEDETHPALIGVLSPIRPIPSRGGLLHGRHQPWEVLRGERRSMGTREERVRVVLGDR